MCFVTINMHIIKHVSSCVVSCRYIIIIILYLPVLPISLYVVPSAPSYITTLPFTTTLTVRWDFDDDEGFSYRLHVQKKGSTEIKTFGSVTPPYNITGLESNTEYTVVVEAYNPLGSANSSVVGYTLPEGEGNIFSEHFL